MPRNRGGGYDLSYVVTGMTANSSGSPPRGLGRLPMTPTTVNSSCPMRILLPIGSTVLNIVSAGAAPSTTTDFRWFDLEVVEESSLRRRPM